MSDGSTSAKPGAGTPGFAQSTWRLVALIPYRAGLAGANACVSLLPVAVACARPGAALLRGGLQ